MENCVRRKLCGFNKSVKKVHVYIHKMTMRMDVTQGVSVCVCERVCCASNISCEWWWRHANERTELRSLFTERYGCIKDDNDDDNGVRRICFCEKVG